MGRGNECVNGINEGQWLIPYDLLDEDQCHNVWEELSHILQMDICAKWKSFNPEFKYVRRYPKDSKHIIAESELFMIAMVDNEWSAAIQLLPQEDMPEGLQSRHFQSYYIGLRDIILDNFNEVSFTTSAWTHGTLSKQEVEQYGK